MDDLMRRIKELDRYRIEYFLHSPNNPVDVFKREMREVASQLIQEIPLNVSGGTRSYLLGKILNTGPDYDAKSEEQLEHSLRTDSKRTDAHLELGQCVWKRNDLEKAHSHFKRAVEQERSPKALCLLSAALRTKATRHADLRERITILSEALLLCEEALTLKKDYAFAHYSTANTRLARFFACQQMQESELTLALESFASALSAEHPPFIEPNLHLNYALALCYKQNYASSLAQFRIALAIEPHFSQAKMHFERTAKFLGDLRESIWLNAHVPQRKLRSLVSTFPPISHFYRNGQTKSPRLREYADVCELMSKEEAENTSISLRCIGTVSHEQQIPITLICIDRAGEVLGLSLFNCSDRFGALIGDTLTIIEPRLIRVALKELELDLIAKQKVEERDLVLLRITNPKHQLLKNGKPISSKDCAFASLSIETNGGAGSSMEKT